MKIVCDCGNEVELNTKDEETGKESDCTDEEGQYATVDGAKLRFWESHDRVGIVCEVCQKSIWLFC